MAEAQKDIKDLGQKMHQVVDEQDQAQDRGR